MPVSTKRKAPATLATPVSRVNAKLPTKNTIDESHTSVAGTDIQQSSALDTIEISSDEAKDEEYVSESDEEHNSGNAGASPQLADVKPFVNGKGIKKSQPDEAQDDSDDEITSPSFGELLRGNDMIDVPASLQQSAAAKNAVSQTSNNPAALSSYQSLSTVLSQALKTDDIDLLETCLQTNDLTTVRNTIERIDSSLAGILLNKLAARLYRRPGRAGNLMVWVQWTLVAHGGALASQPNVIKGLSGLQKVLAERAKGLNSLLALKGKLDLLDSQMDLRRKMQQGNSGLGDKDESDDEEEANVIWVEGEDDDNSRVNGTSRTLRKLGHGNDVDDAEVVPITNGFGGESEDDNEDDSASEEEVADSDAEEPLDEDEVVYDEGDDSMGEDEESDNEPAPPSKLQKVAGFFTKKR